MSNNVFQGRLLNGAGGGKVRKGAAVDVVIVTPGDIARYRDSHALVIKPALNEGRVVYEARCSKISSYTTSALTNA